MCKHIPSVPTCSQSLSHLQCFYWLQNTSQGSLPKHMSLSFKGYSLGTTHGKVLQSQPGTCWKLHKHARRTTTRPQTYTCVIMCHFTLSASEANRGFKRETVKLNLTLPPPWKNVQGMCLMNIILISSAHTAQCRFIPHRKLIQQLQTIRDKSFHT